MSSQRRERVERLREELLGNWPGDSPRECLRAAERADSTTPYEEMERCPECASVRIRTKPNNGWRAIERRIETEYVCVNCCEHFDNPIPPLTQFDDLTVDEQRLLETRIRQLAEDSLDNFAGELDCDLGKLLAHFEKHRLVISWEVDR